MAGTPFLPPAAEGWRPVRAWLARALGARVPGRELRVVVARMARGRAGFGAVAVAVIVLGLFLAGRGRAGAGAAAAGDLGHLDRAQDTHGLLRLFVALPPGERS